MKTATFKNEHGEEFLVIMTTDGFYLFSSETDYEAVPLFGELVLSKTEAALVADAVDNLVNQQ